MSDSIIYKIVGNYSIPVNGEYIKFYYRYNIDTKTLIIGVNNKYSTAQILGVIELIYGETNSSNEYLGRRWYKWYISRTNFEKAMKKLKRKLTITENYECRETTEKDLLKLQTKNIKKLIQRKTYNDSLFGRPFNSKIGIQYNSKTRYLDFKFTSKSVIHWFFDELKKHTNIDLDDYKVKKQNKSSRIRYRKIKTKAEWKEIKTTILKHFPEIKPVRILSEFMRF